MLKQMKLHRLNSKLSNQIKQSQEIEKVNTACHHCTYISFSYHTFFVSFGFARHIEQLIDRFYGQKRVKNTVVCILVRVPFQLILFDGQQSCSQRRREIRCTNETEA
jgi:hypothetical protein